MLGEKAKDSPESCTVSVLPGLKSCLEVLDFYFKSIRKLLNNFKQKVFDKDLYLKKIIHCSVVHN